MDEKTTCFRVPYGHTQGSVITLHAVQTAPSSTTGAHMKHQQEVSQWTARSLVVSVTSLIRVPDKQCTSLDSTCHRRGASVSLRGVSYYCHLLPYSLYFPSE